MIPILIAASSPFQLLVALAAARRCGWPLAGGSVFHYHRANPRLLASERRIASAFDLAHLGNLGEVEDLAYACAGGDHWARLAGITGFHQKWREQGRRWLGHHLDAECILMPLRTHVFDIFLWQWFRDRQHYLVADGLLIGCSPQPRLSPIWRLRGCGNPFRPDHLRFFAPRRLATPLRKFGRPLPLPDQVIEDTCRHVAQTGLGVSIHVPTSLIASQYLAPGHIDYDQEQRLYAAIIANELEHHAERVIFHPHPRDRPEKVDAVLTALPAKQRSRVDLANHPDRDLPLEVWLPSSGITALASVSSTALAAVPGPIQRRAYTTTTLPATVQADILRLVGKGGDICLVPLDP